MLALRGLAGGSPRRSGLWVLLLATLGAATPAWAALSEPAAGAQPLAAAEPEAAIDTETSESAGVNVASEASGRTGAAEGGASAAEPGAAEPGAAEPGAAEPGAAEPGAAPETTQPPPPLAAEGPELEHEPDARVDAYRTPFDALMQRSIGSTSRRVLYDWRRANLQLRAVFAIPAELNNFESRRAGLGIRVPTDGVLLAFDVSYVAVSGSVSSRQLALTPYRQPGRPTRLQVDASLLYPLAEGIMTAARDFVPDSELVFSAAGRLSYHFYPSAYRDMTWTQALASTVAPSLSDKALRNLARAGLPGMEVDRARYSLMLGVVTDVYFRRGAFFGVESLVGLPLLGFVTNTKMDYGFELGISLGLSL